MLHSQDHVRHGPGGKAGGDGFACERQPVSGPYGLQGGHLGRVGLSCRRPPGRYVEGRGAVSQGLRPRPTALGGLKSRGGRGSAPAAPLPWKDGVEQFGPKLCGGSVPESPEPKARSEEGQQILKSFVTFTGADDARLLVVADHCLTSVACQTKSGKSVPRLQVLLAFIGDEPPHDAEQHSRHSGVQQPL